MNSLNPGRLAGRPRRTICIISSAALKARAAPTARPGWDERRKLMATQWRPASECHLRPPARPRQQLASGSASPSRRAPLFGGTLARVGTTNRATGGERMQLKRGDRDESAHDGDE
jgi:hypothetical protein